MLIKALSDYYDILAENGRVLPDGYSNVKVHYLVCLTPEGKIDEIIDWQNRTEQEDKKGKIKTYITPKNEVMPQRTEKPGIDGNVIEHRPLYLFGLNYDKDNAVFTSADKTGKAEKSHSSFVEKNLTFLEGLDSPVINAYRAFMRNWDPEAEYENERLLTLGKAYASSGFIFCLTGHPELLLHQDSQVKEKWENEYAKIQENQENVYFAQCGISGERLPVARIHGKIKGVLGGLSTGTVLVGFNNPSESSYGNDQSYNSNVSEIVMKKYVESLNYLLNGDGIRKPQKEPLDDVTVTYWVMSENQACADLLGDFFFGNQSSGKTAEETEELLRDMMADAREGKIVATRICSVEGIDPAVDFYLLGLKANSSRLSVKFLYRRKFGEILQNIAQHQNDMQISEQARPVPLWRIKRELLSPKSKNETVDPSLMSKIMEAILYGTRYPAFLLSQMVRRVQTDADVEVNAVRAGVIKACILRGTRKKEELKVALDKENQNQPYVCGRLFAALEKLQQDASEKPLNKTIKDAYFASASSKPALVFPKLMNLAQYHLKKSKYETHHSILIGEIMDKLTGEFPNALSLEDQGRFIIGYYQQRQAFFVKKENQIQEDEKNGTE